VEADALDPDRRFGQSRPLGRAAPSMHRNRPREELREEVINMEIALTETERQLLISLLESELQQVRSEGYHAESHDVKVLLKERKASVNQILQRLKEG